LVKKRENEVRIIDLVDYICKNKNISKKNVLRIIFALPKVIKNMLHRINKKKNSSINNVVVLCDECKKYIQKYCGDNIYLAYTPKHNRKIYFRDLGKDYRAIIMSKIRYFRNKDKDNEVKKEG